MLFLKKFIAGVLFATAILPLVDSVTSLTMTGLEALKSSWSIKIAECNNIIQKLGNDETASSTRTVGFFVPTKEEEGNEDEIH